MTTPLDWAVMKKVTPTLAKAMERAQTVEHTVGELALLNEIKTVWDVTKLWRKKFDWDVLMMFVIAAMAYEEEENR